MDTGLGAKAYAIIEQGKIGMILSSRPTDRRQLIEEAAGITKYKARRRAAELKLEAAQQNLTRLEDIIYEIDRQRGSLKRQAAKARRYTRLRDEMRRWEKVLFARRYRTLSEAIESARARLHEARTNEAAASARLAEVENELGRIRIELATADAAATQARETVHAHELEINRRQQQIALDTQQAEMLLKRADELEVERQQLEARREPERLALDGAPPGGGGSGDRARRSGGARRGGGRRLHPRAAGHRGARTGCRARARATSTRCSTRLPRSARRTNPRRPSASAPSRPMAASISKRASSRAELDTARSQRQVAAEALHRAQESLEAARIARASREFELSSARIEHEWRSRDVRTREQDLATMTARLQVARRNRHASLRICRRGAHGARQRQRQGRADGRAGGLHRGRAALRARRRSVPRRSAAAHPGRAARTRVGRTAVDSPGKRRPLRLHRRQASDGQFFREHGGSLRVDGGSRESTQMVHAPVQTEAPAGTVALSSVVRVGGPFPHGDSGGDGRRADRGFVRSRVAHCADGVRSRWRPSTATCSAAVTSSPAATRPSRAASSPPSARSRSCARQIAESNASLEQLIAETAGFEQTIAHATAAIAGLSSEIHRQEKEIVGVEGQAKRAAEDESRVQQRADLVATEISRVREEIAGLDARQAEARESIARLNEQKIVAETGAQRRAAAARATARDTAEGLSLKAAEARATHAGLVERSAARRRRSVADGRRRRRARAARRIAARATSR